jgi:hypothetical protein
LGGVGVFSRGKFGAAAGGESEVGIDNDLNFFEGKHQAGGGFFE